jgi:hypothetical protein
MDLNLHSLPLPIAIVRGKIEEICSKCTMGLIIINKYT